MAGRTTLPLLTTIRSPRPLLPNPLMAGHTRTKTQHSARPNGVRSDKKVCALLRTAYVQCLREMGVSVRRAADECRVAPSTTQRWIAGATVVSVPAVLRSKRLSPCFVANLHLLVTIREKSAPYVVRARKGNVSPKRVTRQRRKVTNGGGRK